MKKYFALLAGLFLLLGASINAYAQLPLDSTKNHYKTWKIQTVPFTQLGVRVTDQFLTDTIILGQIEYISNPTKKDAVRIPPTADSTLHFNWYRAFGRNVNLEVKYWNQIEGNDTVPIGRAIDLLEYLLVPAQKLPHPVPSDLATHYKAYRIRYPTPVPGAHQLDDQFDVSPENDSNLVPVYFLTPCIKNGVPALDNVTHYVAYRIQPTSYVGPPRITIDQFDTNNVIPQFSELLLVPTKKVTFIDPNALPALTTYGLIVLALLLAGTAVWVVWKKRRMVKGGLA